MERSKTQISALTEANGISRQEALAAIKTLLQWIGENPSRKGLHKTPERVLNSFAEFFQGYTIDPRELLENAFENTEGYDEAVILRDIDITSYCEHHMVPFIGKAHIAYVPDTRIVGISKLARVADAYARRLQIQEQLTIQIAAAINDVLKPKGVGVVIEASHQCLSIRGVRKPNVSMVTSRMLGIFKTDPSLRASLMNLAAKSI